MIHFNSKIFRSSTYSWMQHSGHMGFCQKYHKETTPNSKVENLIPPGKSYPLSSPPNIAASYLSLFSNLGWKGWAPSKALWNLLWSDIVIKQRISAMIETTEWSGRHYTKTKRQNSRTSNTLIIYTNFLVIELTVNDHTSFISCKQLLPR